MGDFEITRVGQQEKSGRTGKAGQEKQLQSSKTEYVTKVRPAEKLSDVIDRAIKEDPAIKALLEKYPCLRRDIMYNNDIKNNYKSMD
jgi:hypothetical protein